MEKKAYFCNVFKIKEFIGEKNSVLSEQIQLSLVL